MSSEIFSKKEFGATQKITGAAYDRIKLIQGQAKMLDRTIRAILPVHKHRKFALDHLKQAADWAIQLVTELEQGGRG